MESTSVLKNLLHERNKANEAARAIVDAALAEGRSLTAEDKEAIARADADFDAKNAMIEEIRRIDAREAEVREAVAAAPEARAESRIIVPRQSDADLLRAIASGEMRSYTFEQRAAIETGSTGAPVPTDFYGQVIGIARAVGPMLNPSIVTVLNTSGGNALQIPTQATWSTGTVTAEGDAAANSEPTFNTLASRTLNAYKYSFLMQVSNEMLTDSGVDLLGFLAQQAGNALGYVANTALTTGGDTTEPQGIVAAAGSGVTGGTGVSGAFTHDNVVDLVYSLDAAARALPGFGIMGSTSAIAKLRKLQDGGGYYVWQPSMQLGQPDRVLGYVCYENPAMAAVGTANKSLIAGHLPSYFVRQVSGVQIARSDDYAFAQDLVTLRASIRLDGLLTQTSHVKYFVGGTA